MKNFTTKEALHIIMAAAKSYKKLLENQNFIFIYRNRDNNQIEYFETVFLARHFQHLCGVDYIDKNTGKVLHNATDFYNRCINNQLSEKEVLMRSDGTTSIKLEALPKLVSFVQFSKMTVAYHKSRPKLSVDRLAGTTNYCLGFTFNNGYYMPSSCLLEDIRKLGNNPSRILAILSKKNESTEMVYNTIRYVAKGVPLDKLELPDKLKMLIDLKDYREK